MPPLATPWTITTTPFDDADADRLRRAQRRELDARYGSSDHEPGVPPSAADVPVFLVARSEDGTALACGGLRPLTDDVLGPGVVEVKRMYTAPEARGTGVATAVLRALEEEARRLGATRLVLETGTAQPDAIRFYQREGYAPIPLFGAYVGSGNSVCFGRSLGAGAAGADGAVRVAGAQRANTSSSV
ncbi:GNAT family N-acetyltransferase [Curtobacterium sp. NPDC089689]|uniref:GNAT family N-acetyltransferase n=1 Tax=Curtobacterium sp. NPDC089689 TaxID=3363968 RepID=UPI00381B0585